MRKNAKQFSQIFSLIFFMVGMLVFNHAAAGDICMEIFDENGATVSLSQGEVAMLQDKLPSVVSIIAHKKKSARSDGSVNLYISFKTSDGIWKETSAQINGNLLAQYIADMIGDELK